MRRDWLAVWCALPLAVVTIHTEGQQGIRQIWRNTQPIASRLMPGDRVVEIRMLSVAQTAPLYQSPEVELGDYRWLEEIVVVRELERRPMLASKDSWIRTHVRAVVEKVLKTNRMTAAVGGRVDFEYEGGELVINGVTVRAMHTPVFNDRLQLVGLRYLEDRYHPELHYLQPQKLYGLTDDGTLQRWQFVDGTPSPPSLLYERNLTEVEDFVLKHK